MAKKTPQQNPQALKTFPPYLKRIREEAGFTQEQLGVRSGMTGSAISNFERKRGPGLPTWLSAGQMADTLELEGPERGVFFLAAGHTPPGCTVTVDDVPGDEVVLNFDEDDLEAPIIHGLSNAA